VALHLLLVGGEDARVSAVSEIRVRRVKARLNDILFGPLPMKVEDDELIMAKTDKHVALGRTPMRAANNRVRAKVDFEGDLEIQDGLHAICLKPAMAAKLAFWIIEQEEFINAYERREIKRANRRSAGRQTPSSEDPFDYITVGDVRYPILKHTPHTPAGSLAAGAEAVFGQRGPDKAGTRGESAA
jgi:hypothetical protein